MTAPEVLVEATKAGIDLRVEGGQVRARSKSGPIPEHLKAGLSANRDQIKAVLRLREVHRTLGLSEEDIEFVERALLSGAVSEIRIVAQPCPAEPV